MLDTGSTSNFVSPAFATVHRIRAFPLEQQLTLQLGCIGSRSRITHGAHAQMRIRAFNTQLYFDVANIDRYNCILGIPFLRQNAVIVDFGRQVLRIGRGDVPMIQDSETVAARCRACSTAERTATNIIQAPIARAHRTPRAPRSSHLCSLLLLPLLAARCSLSRCLLLTHAACSLCSCSLLPAPAPHAPAPAPCSSLLLVLLALTLVLPSLAAPF